MEENIFGKEVLVPAGIIVRVDPQEKQVFVDRTEEQIKSAPAVDKGKHIGGQTYHDQLSNHHGRPTQS
ncbi:hypothetical protein [Streptomyces sp. NBC_01334]|uniref:hypothetical protein n=1 Tax=Streptomyces sp. NBC_01334 TaxID=2903827 RepID=UPI002E100961|nr:hypothetical protein OG736_01250 [Streptomyces sp. NBC_01334]